MIIKPHKAPPTGREMPIGPREGMLIESVIVRYPDFIFWLAERDPNPGFEKLYTYIEKRVETFDAKPFDHAQCSGRIAGQPCTRAVKRFSLYRGSGILNFWCHLCDPLQLGGNETKIEILNKYYDGLSFLEVSGATRDQMRKFVRRLAEAKGLAGNVTDRAVLKFFYGDAAR
jgi:hypothetical protein